LDLICYKVSCARNVVLFQWSHGLLAYLRCRYEGKFLAMARLEHYITPPF